MNEPIRAAMDAAIAIAKEHQTPFGAVILDGERVVEVAANTGKQDGPLYHAEIHAMLNLGPQLRHLEQPVLVTTCEPCPMCMGAAIWARMSEIYFGISIGQASQFLGQILVSAQDIADASFHRPRLTGGILEEEVLELFRRFRR
ncbi:MAG: nucleoside deaminase [Bacteroidota bacterium]